MRADRIVAAILVAWLSSACSTAPPPGKPAPAPAAEAAEPLSNTLRWSTASEVDNFGFDIYRGDEEDGPFERLTVEPIPGAGTTDLPQEYSWVDESIEAGRPYWYYIESISVHGEREPFTPVVQVAAKGGGGE